MLDCSAVHGVDVTAMQALIDTRNQLDRHAAPDAVEWHVAGLSSRWTRRAFGAAGFGYPPAKSLDVSGGKERLKTIFSVAATVGQDGHDEQDGIKTGGEKIRVKDEESIVGLDDVDRVSSSLDNRNGSGSTRVRSADGLPIGAAAVQGVNRPWFHIDVAAAVESAIASIEGRQDTGKIH